jgi:ammonium transporter, Amt family
MPGIATIIFCWSTPVLLNPATFVCIASILLVPLAIAGLSLINTGLGRSRSASHIMVASLCVMAVAAVVYFACGFAWQGFAGQPAHVLRLSGKTWNWLGAGRFFFGGVSSGSVSAVLTAWLGMFSVALAAAIPLGSGADRWRLGASCASTVLLAGWTYPLFAHWVWGGGWLAQLGINFGLGHGFLDVGGASSIQVVGGLTALSIAWILGPRQGKYGLGGMMVAIPGHNTVYILFGCMLALLGWLGLDSAGAILFAGVEPGRVALIGICVTLAASTGALAAAVITRVRFGKPDASLTANGWVSGLVASSAACAFVTPAVAAFTGLIAGGLVTLAVEWLDAKLEIDDPGGAISVHGVCGIWGLFAAGLFARFPVATLDHPSGSLQAPVSSDAGQLLAQIVGIATLIGFVLPLTYGLNWALDRFFRQRVAPEGERQGLDLYELGAGAYPEFVTHLEEWTQQ